MGNLTKIVTCNEQCDVKIAKSNRTLMKFFKKKHALQLFRVKRNTLRIII